MVTLARFSIFISSQSDANASLRCIFRNLARVFFAHQLENLMKWFLQISNIRSLNWLPPRHSSHGDDDDGEREKQTTATLQHSIGLRAEKMNGIV